MICGSCLTFPIRSNGRFAPTYPIRRTRWRQLSFELNLVGSQGVFLLSRSVSHQRRQSLTRPLGNSSRRDEERYREASKAISEKFFGPILCDPDVFMDRMRKGIDLLLLVAADLADQESGRGRPSDRPKENLMLALRNIWFDFTGSEPGQGGDPYETGYRTPFERFADAVFAALPPEYRPRSPRYSTRRINRAKSTKKA